MRTNSAWGSASTIMAMVAAAWGASPEYTLQRLEDRLNSHALSSIVGTVDYEYLYAAQASSAVVLLEEPPAPAPALPDTGAGTAVPAAPQASPAIAAITALDTVRSAQGTDSLVVQRLQAPGSAEPLSPGADRPPGRLTRADLPEDLRSVDTAGLRRAMPLAAPGADALFLAVRQVGDDHRYPGERLTLADQELSAEGRRRLRWQIAQLFDRWPSGTVLVLERLGGSAVDGQAEFAVRWSFRSPSSSVGDPSSPSVTGQTTLRLVEGEGGWRVSHVEGLIADLREGVDRARRGE